PPHPSPPTPPPPHLPPPPPSPRPPPARPACPARRPGPFVMGGAPTTNECNGSATHHNHPSRRTWPAAHRVKIMELWHPGVSEQIPRPGRPRSPPGHLWTADL